MIGTYRRFGYMSGQSKGVIGTYGTFGYMSGQSKGVWLVHIGLVICQDKVKVCNCHI